MSFTAPSGDRWTEVYLATAGRAMSSCGDLLAATALILALQSRGAGGFAVAAILLAAALPPVVFAPVAGRLADRLDSRALLVTVGLGQALVCVALAYAGHPVLVIALAAALGTGLAVTTPTLAALVPAMVGRDSLARASALGQTANALGGLVAPALGGLLVGLWGTRVPLLVDAVSYLAIVAVGLLLRTRRNAPASRTTPAPAPRADEPRPAGSRVARSRPAGIRAAAVRAAGSRPPATGQPGGAGPEPAWRLRNDPLLWPVLVLCAAVITVVSAVNVLEVFFIRGTLHASPIVFGLLGAVWMGCTMIGAWLLAQRSLADPGLARALFAALLLTCACLAALAAAPSVGWLLPGYIVGGISNGALNAGIGALLGRRIPADHRGRGFARFGAVVNAGTLIGFLLGGALVVGLPTRVVLAGVGLAGVLVSAVFAAPLLRAAAREARPAPAPRPATLAGAR